MTRRARVLGFARQAGELAALHAGRHATAEAAWLGLAPRLSGLRGVGPVTLEAAERAFLDAYEAEMSARFGQVAA